MNLGAFGILVLIRDRRPFSYSLDEMAGLGRAMPLASFAMMLFMLSLTGIPPLAGFWGKFYLFAAVVDSGPHVAGGRRRAHERRLGLLLPAGRLVHVLPRARG